MISSLNPWMQGGRRTVFLFLANFCGSLVAALFVALDPTRAVPPGDAPGYIRLAENLLTTGAFTSFVTAPDVPEVFRTPGYPLFLAFFFLLSGHSLLVVVLAQGILKAISGVLLAFLTDRLAGSNRAGFAAGILWALAPLPLVFTGVIATETLFTVLFLLTLYLLTREGHGTSLLSGFLLGIAALVRPIGNVLIPILLPAVLATGKGRSRVLRMFAFLMGCGLALAPWLVRNELAYGRIVFSSIGGSNLLTYNAASCLAHQGGTTWEEGKTAARAEYQRYLEQHNLAPATDVEEGDAMGAAAAEVLLRTPIACAWFNLLDSLNSLRPGASYTVMFLRPDLLPGGGALEGELSPAFYSIRDPMVFAVSAVLTGFYILLYILAAAGLIWSIVQKRWKVIWLILLPVFFLLYAPGLAGNARFRIPVEPGLCLLAAVALCELGPALTARRSKRIPPGT